MHEDGEHHQVGGPGVRGADQPAEVHHKGDLADRFEGFGAGPVIDQQQHAGEALDHEEEQRDAAPVVPEGLRVDRDRLFAREGGELGEPEPLIHPVVNVGRDCLGSHISSVRVRDLVVRDLNRES